MLFPLLLSVSISVIIVAIATYVYKPDPKSSLSFSDNTLSISLLLAFFLLRLAILELRKVYIIFRKFRNPVLVLNKGLKSKILTAVTELVSLIVLPSLLLFYFSSAFYNSSSLTPWQCVLLLRIYRYSISFTSSLVIS